MEWILIVKRADIYTWERRQWPSVGSGRQAKSSEMGRVCGLWLVPAWSFVGDETECRWREEVWSWIVVVVVICMQEARKTRCGKRKLRQGNKCRKEGV